MSNIKYHNQAEASGRYDRSLSIQSQPWITIPEKIGLWRYRYPHEKENYKYYI